VGEAEVGDGGSLAFHLGRPATIVLARYFPPFLRGVVFVGKVPLRQGFDLKRGSLSAMRARSISIRTLEAST
jgi:hypothetical protein